MHIARGSAHASPRAGCARDFTTFSINLTFLRGGLLVAKLLVQVFAMCIRDRLISAFIPTAGAAAAAATVAAAGAAAALGLHFIDALFFSPLAPQTAVVVLPRCSSSLIYTSHRQRGSFSFSPPASPSSSYTFISLQLARLSFRRLLFLILSLLSLSLSLSRVRALSPILRSVFSVPCSRALFSSTARKAVRWGSRFMAAPPS